MIKKLSLITLVALSLSACASSSPRIIQATSDMQQVHLTNGMATQIEMPDSGRVQSVTVGNPNLVTADHVDNVVNLVPKDGSGETNLIVRSEQDGKTEVYQYRVVVQAH